MNTNNSVTNKKFEDALFEFNYDKSELRFWSTKNTRCIPESIVAHYFIDLVDTSMNTKSVDEIKKVIKAYQSNPQTFAEIEFEKIIIVENSSGLADMVVARECGLDLNKLSHKLKFLSSVMKIYKAEKECFEDLKNEENLSNFNEMTNRFHVLCEKHIETLRSKSKVYSLKK